MPHTYHHIPYAATGYFSQLVSDYLAGQPLMETFYSFSPDNAGLVQAISQREKIAIDRALLVASLQRQYQDIESSEAVQANITSLLQPKTFTITTAHQPNLMTGYLYFIYKILHTIKLAENLNNQYTDKHFVPVYYMGSEDNDIEELGVFRFRGEIQKWDGSGQKGAVGRMSTLGLKALLQQVLKLFGPPGEHCDHLIEIITTAYFKHPTIGSATKYLVNELFGRYGLVIVDPDDRQLKSAFIPVMADDLLNNTAHRLVTEQTTLLEQRYKTQAFPRPINLFYLRNGLRERIEQKGDAWVVLNTDTQFTQTELLAELHAHPERFSPNVILRGLFQSTILPDVAFIGGGAEVAYWLQLKTLFHHYNAFYPVILLRQSVQWLHPLQTKLRQQCHLSVLDLFKPILELENEYVANHATDDWRTNQESDALVAIFDRLTTKATSVDPTLGPAAAATLTKVKQYLASLEKKMLRAEKRKMAVDIQRLQRLKASVFPNNSLQERTENFAEYYLDYGPEFFDIIKDGLDPLANKFLLIE